MSITTFLFLSFAYLKHSAIFLIQYIFGVCIILRTKFNLDWKICFKMACVAAMKLPGLNIIIYSA